jgi:hypothetical protein
VAVPCKSENAASAPITIAADVRKIPINDPGIVRPILIVWRHGPVVAVS